MAYQVRMTSGLIKEFETAEELFDSVKETDVVDIEKVSFDGPDGTRVRLLYEGNGTFSLTLWDDKSLMFRVFP